MFNFNVFDVDSCIEDNVKGVPLSLIRDTIDHLYANVKGENI